MVAALAACCLMVPGEARGEEVGRFSPSEAGSQWFVADSLDMTSDRVMFTKWVTDYSYKPWVVYDGGGEGVASIVEHQVVGNLGVASTFFDRFRVGVNLPVSLYTVGESWGGYPAPSAVALGDVRLSVDARLFGRYGSPFTMAVGGRGYFPAGVGGAYIDREGLAFDGHVLAAGSAGYVTYAGRGGYTFGMTEAGAGVADAKLAVGAKLMDGDLFVGPEASYVTPVRGDSLFSVGASSLEVMLGSHYDVTPSWRVGLGGGVGFFGAVGTPMARGLMTVEWMWNQPLPVPVPLPPPPLVVEEPAPVVVVLPEPPKVVDTDGDGVPDELDSCPALAGSTEPGVKTKGCPVKIVVDEKTLIDGIAFEKNAAAVKQSSSAAMDQVLTTLKSLPPNSKFRVEGHTDNKSGKKKSVELSKKRADAVVKWFVDKGFAAEKFDSAGLGQEKPVESNATTKGRAKNRRVEVYIIEENTESKAPEGTDKK